jgi:YVTN family beta-propeller protein
MRQTLVTIWLVLGVSAAFAGGAPAAVGSTAYVVNDGSNTVTPIDLQTNTADATITVGTFPTADAVLPDGKTVYVTNSGTSTVTPIDTATDTPGAPIPVGTNPKGIAITPDGTTAYVADYGANSLMPINLKTDTPGSAIPAGSEPYGVAITPDGKTAYVTDFGGNEVTPIDLTTNTADTPIAVGANPIDVAITPDGKTAYAVNANAGSVTPIDTATHIAGPAISLAGVLQHIAIAPGGETAYVTGSSNGSLTPINTTTNTPETSIPVAGAPRGVAVAPGGTTAYVTNSGAATVTPVYATTGLPGPPISVGADPLDIAITPDQAPTAAFSVSAAGVGQTSTFDGSASSSPVGSVVSYRWSFGDGHSITTTSPVAFHVYSQPGTFTAQLTVTNSAGTSTAQVFTGKEVSNEGGPQATTTHTLTVTAAGGSTPPPGSGPSGSGTPRLTDLRVTPRTATIAGRLVDHHCTAATAKNTHRPSCRRAVKLQISYTLSAKARVVFTFKRKTTGRTVNGRCVKLTRANRNHRRCTQLVGLPGQIARSSDAGRDHVTFDGTLAGHRLPAGTYQLTATPTTATARKTQFRLIG